MLSPEDKAAVEALRLAIEANYYRQLNSLENIRCFLELGEFPKPIKPKAARRAGKAKARA